jgi:hemerythrin-like domain-containing protein
MSLEADKRAVVFDVLTTAPPRSLLCQPFDYISADHFRLRTLCDVLDEMADESDWDIEIVEAIRHFLDRDYQLHIIDEEEDLLPLLRRRAEPEEKIGEHVDRLSKEHVRDGTDAVEIRNRLATIAERRTRKPARKSFRELLVRFAADERRHLNFENAVILPLARVRLTDADKRNLSRRMARRRGVDNLECMSDAG